MNTIVIIAALLLAVALVLQIARRPKKAQHKIANRQPLTKREQAMYYRLCSALPEHVVLAQVSLGALLTARSYAARNRFSQKIADFVICTKAFEVIAVIELDDASHRTKRKADAERDAMITGAGLRAIRYPNIPNAETIARDINGQAGKPETPQLSPSPMCPASDLADDQRPSPATVGKIGRKGEKGGALIHARHSS